MNIAAQLLVLTNKKLITVVLPHYFYCGNTALFLPLPRGYRKIFTVPTVLPWNFPNLPRYYRGITAFPITMSLSINDASG